jgi:hypothetical protein
MDDPTMTNRLHARLLSRIESLKTPDQSNPHQNSGDHPDSVTISDFFMKMIRTNSERNVQGRRSKETLQHFVLLLSFMQSH